MKRKNLIRTFILIIGVLILITGLGWFAYSQNYGNIRNIQSYEDCIKAGYPDLLSYPGQCNTPNRQHFIQPLSQEEKNRLENQIKTLKNLQRNNIQISSSASPGTTSNWKTYENKNINISFLYPPEWYIGSELQDSVMIITTNPKEGGNWYGFSVQQNSNPQKLSTLEWIKQQYKRLGTTPNMSIKITINSLPAMRENPDSAPEGQLTTIVYVANKEFIYVIKGITRDGHPEDITTFNQILSTFKFTN